MYADIGPVRRKNIMKHFLLRLQWVHALFALVDRLHLQATLRVALNVVRHRNRKAHLLALLPKILSDLPPTSWSVLRFADTVTDITVAIVGPRHDTPAAVVKITSSDEGRGSLHQRGKTLAALHADARLGEWRNLIPQPLASGEVDGHAYQVQSAVEGIEVWPLLADSQIRHQVHRWAAHFTTDLAQRTGTPTYMDDGALARWIDDPCTVLRDALQASGCMNEARARQVTDLLAGELRATFIGHTIPLGWTHGDLMPGNILVSPDGSRVCGLVDWELARPDGLPFLDLLFLMLSIRMVTERRELGDVMCALLEGASWSPQETALLEAALREQIGDDIDLRSLLLLCWLHHVAANLRKSGRYAQHAYWLVRNVETVLNSLYPLPRRWLHRWPRRAAAQSASPKDALLGTTRTPV
jgi:hypothetical protein